MPRRPDPATRRRSAATHGPSMHRPSTHRPALRCAVLLAALGLLVGCGSQDAGTTASPTSAGASPSATASATPTGLDRDAASVRAALDGKIDPSGASEQELRQKLVAAGWSDSAIETGQNLTPTGLDVDNIDAAVATRNGCVLADVRSDGGVTVVTAKKLATGRCLVGTVHR